MPATKSRFMLLYRDRLNAKYEWAQDDLSLSKFMARVGQTLDMARGGAWDHTGEDAQYVWKLLGGKGKVTLKGLRALPE